MIIFKKNSLQKFIFSINRMSLKPKSKQRKIDGMLSASSSPSGRSRSPSDSGKLLILKKKFFF